MRDEADVKRLATLEAVALAPARLVYSVWIALAFLAVGVAALVLLALLPGVARRRAAARAAARAFLRLAGMPLRVKFLERLPPGQCVVVCNHASYLDGIVLAAALPPRFGFVVKREMAGVPLAGVVLRRLGSEFVERFDRQRRAAEPGAHRARDPHADHGRPGNACAGGGGAARSGALRDPRSARRARSHMLRRYCPPT